MLPLFNTYDMKASIPIEDMKSYYAGIADAGPDGLLRWRRDAVLNPGGPKWNVVTLENTGKTTFDETQLYVIADCHRRCKIAIEGGDFIRLWDGGDGLKEDEGSQGDHVDRTILRTYFII
jgi:hypothetical protein